MAHLYPSHVEQPNPHATLGSALLTGPSASLSSSFPLSSPPEVSPGKARVA